MTTAVATILGWLEDACPPALAEEWDAVGLACGDPDAGVDSVLFAVDLTDVVVDEAAGLGAQLIVTHHPLLLRGVHALRRDEPKGRLVLALAAAGIALATAHTNADAAEDGVSDALASTMGLTGLRPLAGALGRVGTLPEPLAAREVGRRLARALPATAGGVRLGGDPERVVTSVAVMGGAGDSFLDVARAAGVDLYVTSDLRHHPASEFLLWEGAPALDYVSHWSAEWSWLPVAERLIAARAAQAGVALDTAVSRINTDPWAEAYASASDVPRPRSSASVSA